MSQKLILRDGRIAPYWEHLCGVGIWPVLVLQWLTHPILATQALLPLSVFYGGLVIIAALALWLWRRDIRINEPVSLHDNVDQTVPIKTRIFCSIWYAVVAFQIGIDIYHVL